MDFEDVKDMDDLASSADQLDVTAPETEAEPANSSDATPGVEAESELLDVVRNVVEPKEEQPEAPASQAESGEVEDPSGEEPKEEPEDFSDVPFGKHPRFKQLLQERNTFKADAQNYRNVQNFIDQHGLAAEEAADGLMIMGLMKTDPAEAWKRMKPMVQNLLVAAGEVLPDDLKAMVQRGEIAPTAALEVSRSRAAVQATQVQRQFEQQRSEQRQVQDAQMTLVTTANSWAADRLRADPNFEAQQEAFMDKVYAFQRREGVPNTPAGVTDQLNRAYREFKAAVPVPAAARAAAPIATRPAVTPLRGGQVAGNQAPVTGGSTLDIINAVVGRRGA